MNSAWVLSSRVSGAARADWARAARRVCGAAHSRALLRVLLGQRGLAAWEKRLAGRCVLRFAALVHYSRVLVYRRCGSRNIRWAPPLGGAGQRA